MMSRYALALVKEINVLYLSAAQIIHILRTRPWVSMMPLPSVQQWKHQLLVGLDLCCLYLADLPIMFSNFNPRHEKLEAQPDGQENDSIVALPIELER